MRQHDGTVLLVHGATDSGLTGHTALHQDLGQIGNGYSKGYVAHPSRAIAPAGRTAFGLVGQLLHVRATAPAGETPAQKRARDTRERLLWRRGVDGLETAPAGTQGVDVCDRLADPFAFDDQEDARGRKYVIRAWPRRRIILGHDPDGPRRLLREHVRGLAEPGRRPRHVPAREGRPARHTVVAIAFTAALLRVPKDRVGHARKQLLAVWVVRVGEVEPPPPGAEGVEGLLLTNRPGTTVAEAWEKVDWYTCRWVVEMFHPHYPSSTGLYSGRRAA